MPLTCSIGLTKKIGLPDYGSPGASCNVQFELDSTLMQTDLEAFQQQVRNAYTACRQAVNDELARQQEARTSGTTVPTSQPSPSNGNGAQASAGANGHRATDKQLDYVRQLAGQIKGLGIRRLDSLAERMFSQPVAELSTLDASGLIDTLKAIKGGQINLDDALNGAAS